MFLMFLCNYESYMSFDINLANQNISIHWHLILKTV